MNKKISEKEKLILAAHECVAETQKKLSAIRENLEQSHQILRESDKQLTLSKKVIAIARQSSNKGTQGLASGSEQAESKSE